MIYLLYGADEFARSEALAALKAQVPPDLAELNIAVLDGKKLKLDALVGACEAYPFIAERRLIGYVGGDGRALVNELSKLASYVGRGGRVTPQEVELLVQDGQEQNLFAFIDELSARRRGAALQGLHRLFADGQAATYILFMVARQVRILLGVKDLAAQRMRPDDIAAQLGQRPFVVRKALDQARGFSGDELARLHDRVLELDHASKTGRIEAETGLEMLVVELCR